MEKVKCKDSKFIFEKSLFFSIRRMLENHIRSDKCPHNFSHATDNRVLNGLAEQLAVSHKHLLDHQRYERVTDSGEKIYTIGNRVVVRHSDDDDSITDEIAALPSVFKGYHIDAAILKSLKRNKFAGIFPGGELFIREKDSTYKTAVDNHGKERPGYSHWYTLSKFCNQILSLAANDAKCIDNRTKNYSDNAVQDAILKASESNLSDFPKEDILIVPQKKFLEYTKKFLSGKEPSFANALFNLVHINDGVCYVNNNVHQEDRLCGYGRGYSVASMIKKCIRVDLLVDHYEYDISTAVQSVQMNLFNQFNDRNPDKVMEITKKIIRDFIIKEKAKVAEDKKYRPIYISLEKLLKLGKTKFLISHKDGARRQISALVKNRCTKDEAKLIITSMTFGTRRGNYAKLSNKYKSENKRDYSGKVGSKLHRHIAEFELEALLLREVCIESRYHGDRKIAIDKDIEECNAKRKFGGQGKHLRDQIMYRIYEIEESIIRKAMMYALDSNYQIHDCVITVKNVSIKALSKYVKEKTGYNLKFSKEYYSEEGALLTAHEIL